MHFEKRKKLAKYGFKCLIQGVLKMVPFEIADAPSQHTSYNLSLPQHTSIGIVYKIKYFSACFMLHKLTTKDLESTNCQETEHNAVLGKGGSKTNWACPQHRTGRGC